MIEVIKKRTMTSKTFDLGGGKFETRVMSYPIHYKTEDGTWEEVNLDIKERKSWEFSHALTENVYRAYFQDLTSENKHLVGIEFVNEDGDELWLNYKLKGANPTEAEKGQETFVFKNCFEGVDVEYVANPDKLKENIILNGKTDIREFTYTLKMGGVSVEQEGEEIYIVEEKTGKTVWEIEKPYMVDAAGEISYGVRYETGHDGEFYVLKVLIEDEEFLENAEYPVYVDPTVSITGWYVWKNLSIAGTRYNAALGRMYVGPYDPGYSNYEEVFSLLTYPEIIRDIVKNEQVEVSKATLRIKVNRDGYGRVSDLGYDGITMEVYATVTEWDETVTYATRPQQDDYLIYSTPYRGTRYFGNPDVGESLAGKWIELDLTRPFKDRRTTGIAFRRNPVSPRHAYIDFQVPPDSPENSPVLTVQYVIKPALAFHDGKGEYYSDNAGNVFKYLDFGTLIAGQTSLPQRVYLRNLSPFEVENVSVRVDNSISPSGVQIQISKYNNPFVPEDYIVFDGVVLDPDEDVSFFVRIATEEGAVAGGNFPIMAKAVPRN